MTTYYKHIGKCKNSGRRCVVVKNQIPGTSDKALIVDIDSLPDAYQNYLMDLVQSGAAQNTNELGDVLARYASPDSGMTMLMSLHTRQYLCQMAISNILMYPAPNFPIELTKVIDLINGGDIGKAKQDHSVHTLHGTVDKMKHENIEKNEKIARNLIMEADRLAFEAAKKRDEAYALSPQLNPSIPGSEGAAEAIYEKPQFNNNPITLTDNSYDYYAKNGQHGSGHNVTVDDIGSKIGKAPPPIKPNLSPEEALLLKISQPGYVPEPPIVIKEEITIEKPKRTRRAKTSK
mgnify:FL=1